MSPIISNFILQVKKCRSAFDKLRKEYIQGDELLRYSAFTFAFAFAFLTPYHSFYAPLLIPHTLAASIKPKRN